MRKVELRMNELLKYETIKELEYQAQFSKYHFNEAQKDYLPRRIRIEWWQQTHYFEHEEEYMESIDYQAIFIQRAQHKAFIQKLDEFEVDEDGLEHQDSIIELLDLITEWLIEHIVKMDKLIGK